MDSDLLLEFNRAIEGLRERNIRLTPAAEVLLFVSISSVEDDQGRLNREVRRNAQHLAIERFPSAIAAISRVFNTRTVDAITVLQYMPRFMSGFCPEIFEDPPPY